MWLLVCHKRIKRRHKFVTQLKCITGFSTSILECLTYFPLILAERIEFTGFSVTRLIFFFLKLLNQYVFQDVACFSLATVSVGIENKACQFCFVVVGSFVCWDCLCFVLFVFVFVFFWGGRVCLFVVLLLVCLALEIEVEIIGIYFQILAIHFRTCYDNVNICLRCKIKLCSFFQGFSSDLDIWCLLELSPYVNKVIK